MQWYIDWVSANVLLSAFIQFMILGTLGEVLGLVAAKQKIQGNLFLWLAKALVWGVLGIMVKYAFVGFSGFQAALVTHGFLPDFFATIPVLTAFSISVFMNAMFGPFLMGTHRFTDNLISGTKGFKGIEKSLFTLLWFWIPAHTVTFMMPLELRIGLAALWSVALGIIMGFTKRKS